MYIYTLLPLFSPFLLVRDLDTIITHTILKLLYFVRTMNTSNNSRAKHLRVEMFRHQCLRNARKWNKNSYRKLGNQFNRLSKKLEYLFWMRTVSITMHTFTWSAKIKRGIHIDNDLVSNWSACRAKRTNYDLSSHTLIHVLKCTHAPHTFKQQNQEPNHSSNIHFKLQNKPINLVFCRRKYLQVLTHTSLQASLLSCQSNGDKLYPHFLLDGFYMF